MTEFTACAHKRDLVASQLILKSVQCEAYTTGWEKYSACDVGRKADIVYLAHI